MLIPRGMSVNSAWLNARYGAPWGGPFAFSPPPREEISTWAMTIPWAFAVQGHKLGNVCLLLPPTLPGIAWMLRDRCTIVDIAGPTEPRGMPMLGALLNEGVQWAGPVEQLPVGGTYHMGFCLSPCGPPPSRAALCAWARLFRPGAHLALAFRAAVEEPLDLPPEWRVVDGDVSVVPGLPGFDPVAYEAGRATAWEGPFGAVGFVGCERSS